MNEVLNYLSWIGLETFPKETWIKEKLGELNAHNPNTYEHSLRVALLAATVASHEHFPSYQRSVLIKAALLHDIGKIEIPNELLEADTLTEEEKKQIDKHVRASFDVVKSYDPLVAKVISGHHEFQPRRYPRASTRISEEMLVKELQFILSLCDNVDSLLSKRSYKEAWPKDKAVEHLAEIFQDPELIETAVTARLTMKD